LRRFLAAAIATALLLGLPAGALAQSTTTNPFTPGAPALPAPTQTATTPTIVSPTTTTTAGSGTLSGGSVAAIAIGAIVLLVGISLFIWRDARRRAPIKHRAGPGTSRDDPRAATRQRAKPRKLSAQERRRRKRGRAR
jgi:outer membrane biosynthesis protein TonB